MTPAEAREELKRLALIEAVRGEARWHWREVLGRLGEPVPEWTAVHRELFDRATEGAAREHVTWSAE